jgi:hypothetical protein
MNQITTIGGFMNKFISIFFLIAVLSLSTGTIHAQSLDYLWAVQAGGSRPDVGRDIAMDGSGNSIVTGDFDTMASFGDTTLTGVGDIFLAKYDGDGNFLWAAQAGGTSGDNGFGIATDGSGNSTVTGQFSNTAAFGNYHPDHRWLW